MTALDVDAFSDCGARPAYFVDQVMSAERKDGSPEAKDGAPEVKAVSTTDLLAALRKESAFAVSVVLANDGSVICSTAEDSMPPEDAKFIVAAFADRERTIRDGVLFLDTQFDVHSFSADLV